MDPINNPFAPGTGNPPPELAGRDKILSDAKIALGRVKVGNHARGQILLGLRGVGKTVLLNRIGDLAADDGFEAVFLEAPEDRGLAEMLVPPLKTLLVRLSRVERAKVLAKRGLGILRSFAAALKVEVGDLGFGVQAEAGTADSGNLEADLPELLLSVASAAKEAGKPVILIIDELQYLSARDLGALITAVHRTGQRGLPLLVIAAGLPQLAALAGEAKSYAERLFTYPDVGRLSEAAARDAIRSPMRKRGAEIAEGALTMIVEQTRGYPYFLQEWGFHTWDAATSSPITEGDVARATVEALAQLDEGFFRVRMDRLTPREKAYMRAMAALGPGPHRSGDIAQTLRIDVRAAGPLRNGLIRKGMIFSPQFGETAFTVPMFDEFMCRSMPDWTTEFGGSSKPSKPKG